MYKRMTVSQRGSAFILASMLLGVSLECRADVLVANSISQDTSHQTTPALSPAVLEIVRLVDAKVDAEVIKGFIQNSPIAYNPTATDLIALTEHGVSSDILVALLHHGAELRAKMAQVQPSVYPSTQTTAPQTTYPVVSDSYSYPYDTGYPYYNYYPNYYYNTVGWPVYGAPFFPFVPPLRFGHGPGPVPAGRFGGPRGAPVHFASAGWPGRGPAGGRIMPMGGVGRPGPAMHFGGGMPGGGMRVGGGGAIHVGGGMPGGGGHPGGGAPGGGGGGRR
jgi:hypothetical protein